MVVLGHPQIRLWRLPVGVPTSPYINQITFHVHTSEEKSAWAANGPSRSSLTRKGPPHPPGGPSGAWWSICKRSIRDAPAYGLLQTTTMPEYNTCKWLVVQRLERCGKRCVGRLCGIHLAQLRKTKGPEPRPCRACGRGTKAETQRCSQGCGSDRARYLLKQAAVILNCMYPGMLHERLRMAERQRTLPFIGLR